jgi:uncharacterized membrane protein YeaQ/YmgE (transglycosylase-associated protein family)
MTFIDIIGWLVIGLIVGAIARLITPGEGSMGCLGTALLGIVGSIVGGYLSQFFLAQPTSMYWRPGFIVSVFGAVIVLFTARLFRGKI